MLHLAIRRDENDVEDAPAAMGACFTVGGIIVPLGERPHPYGAHFIQSPWYSRIEGSLQQDHRSTDELGISSAAFSCVSFAVSSVHFASTLRQHAATKRGAAFGQKSRCIAKIGGVIVSEEISPLLWNDLPPLRNKVQCSIYGRLMFAAHAQKQATTFGLSLTTHGCRGLLTRQ